VADKPLHPRRTGIAPGFRPRGTEHSRMELFSDAVFAFALTLLVVSLEVPRTFRDLMRSMQGFVAFAVCFAVLMQIWFKHYGFFRRYGLQDMTVRVLNSVLLFIVLFYVYPLKFLWTNLLGGERAGFSLAEGRMLLVVYGLGGAAVFLVFVLLYRHAWRLRDELDLSPLERFDTRSAILENLLTAAVPMLSVVMALVLPEHLVGLAGWIYLSYGPLLTWNGIRDGRGRRPLEAAVTGER
jgi:uncharacterized membrane protein